MQEMQLQRFVRLLKQTADEDGQLGFFLGAGCSISSGIPGGASLVRGWLPKLHHQMTGKQEPFEQWLPRELPDHREENPAASYAEVMKRLFPQPPQRRAEVERFVLGKDPAFGYAVLAKLITHKQYAAAFNLVLTTNFDDLVADALYLYSQKKPLVVAHESLASFAELGRSRPLVIKLHGDALLDPRSLEDETAMLDRGIQSVLGGQLRRRGLIFIGYGGNDRGITRFLQGLPENALEWGLYWVNEEIPDNEFGEWLKSKPNAHWIRHLKFDELMVLIFEEFALEHPDDRRFEQLMTTYHETFSSLTEGVDSREEGDTKRVLQSALKSTADEFSNWWAVELAAREFKKSDPEKSQDIYLRGLVEFPRDAALLGNYAAFLHKREDVKEADRYYKQALKADPTHATNLGNYALFLKTQGDLKGAKAYYEQAVQADPTHANNLGNYAGLLKKLGDLEGANVYYKRALEANPTHANHLGNYAELLKERGDLEQAQKYFERAVEADPAHANNIGNYAQFLKEQGDLKEARDFFKRALEIDPAHANNLANYAQLLLLDPQLAEGLKVLQQAISRARQEGKKVVLVECEFYRYAHAPVDERPTALGALKALLAEGTRSPGWKLSANVERAEVDGHPSTPLLGALAGVISDGAELESLDEFEEWRESEPPSPP